ncbi:uncharacterized protein Dwil_GK22828 [Drosophila willistoni]|uniref:Uncharacterized protein n=1 Tax=Drosophila willistoni TaxID=7260 RepID=B4NF31_DROWI|nr:golgin-84 [Drosophila willistoni]EDW83406.1 uncharacterized protein Dwil_GK22828 [Drosophila willistoni]
MSSWITGLADKAENILNKIDQNAATALQTDSPSAAMTSSISSTQSLKTTLSPAKRPFVTNSASSVKSEGSPVVTKELRTKLPTSASFSTYSNPDTVTSAMDTHELAAFKIALSEITAERDELRLRLEALNRDSENFALQQRSQELETLSKTLSDERDKAVHDLNQAQSAHMAYVHSISELETNLAKLQQEYMNTAHKLQMQTKETEQQRMELQEYRSKAQRALQVKDNLIAELKAKPQDRNSELDPPTTSETRFLEMEQNALKQELQHNNEELQRLRLQLEDQISQTRQYEFELSTACQREELLAKELSQSRDSNVSHELEHRLLSQELNSSISTLKQKLSQQTAVTAEREQQVQQLRKRLNEGGHQTNVKIDYESRLQALTESLVERQSLLERVTGERNALRLQYEKMHNQLQQNAHMVDMEHQKGNTNSRNNALLLNSTDDVKAQFPTLMHPSPFDNRVARRFKRALRQADSMGIRVGTFLRRYPMMRISVILYVALLHLWVMFVLLSTTPN